MPPNHDPHTAAQRRRPMREGPALPMQHGRAAANANNCRVPRRAVRLFTCFDRRHGEFLRRQEASKPFLSPIRLLSNQ